MYLNKTYFAVPSQMLQTVQFSDFCFWLYFHTQNSRKNMFLFFSQEVRGPFR